MEVVRVENVCKDFRLGNSVVQALKNVSLTVEKGDFLAMVGPSGSGKTTLLNLIGCIEKPTSGLVCVNGEEVSNHTFDELADVRAYQMGFIFQTFNLLPVLTVAENVEYPLLSKGLPKAVREEKIRQALREVGLESSVDHKPGELSGGQRQRVAIARALVTSPALVLADEPTANLDYRTGTEILFLMKQLNRKLGVTFVFSTHDLKIMSQAGRVVELVDGEIRKA